MVRCNFCSAVIDTPPKEGKIPYCKGCRSIRSLVRAAIRPEGRFSTAADGLHENFIPEVESEEDRKQREEEGMLIRDLGNVVARIKRSNVRSFALHRRQAIQILLDVMMCHIRGDEAIYFDAQLDKMMEQFVINVMKKQRED